MGAWRARGLAEAHRFKPGTAPRDLAGPYQRQLDGDWAGAARVWQDLGCPYEAALALLDSHDEDALREALRS